LLIPIIICFTAGIVLGKLKLDVLEELTFAEWMARVIGIAFAVVTALYLNIIIHEAGHLIFGLISGYRFVSFRIDSLTLVRSKGRFHIKKFNIPGTGGQCLMAPPKLDENGNYPVSLFNLGGILMNLAAAILCIAAAVQNQGMVRMFLIVFAVIGGSLFLTNGIPMKISGVANDGLNLLSMNRDEAGKRAFYVQLDVNARMSDGERLKDMPYELVKLPESIDLISPINTGGRLYEYYWYADRHEFDKAAKVLDEFVPIWDNMIPMLRNMVAMERIYLELIGENRSEVLGKLLAEEVKLYIKRTKYDVHSRRIACGLLFSQKAEESEIIQARAAFEKVVKTNPVEAEAQMSWELSEYMIQQLSKNRD